VIFEEDEFSPLDDESDGIVETEDVPVKLDNKQETNKIKPLTFADVI
jgi:hypothetical protein